MSGTPQQTTDNTDEDPYAPLSSLLKASSDALRLEILRVLDKKSFGVQELCKIFAVRQPAMSHHLKLLAQNGLIANRKEGNSIFYHRSHQAPTEQSQELWQSLLATVDALPLRADLAARIAMLHLDRAASSQQFFEHNADSFRAQQEQITDYRHYSAPVKQFIDSAALPARDLALEIGPGEGAFLGELSADFSHVTACDISPSMLALAKNCAQQQGLDNIDFILADSRQLVIQQTQADCVVANMVLHHVPSPADMVQDIAAMLRPGGSFFLAELCRHDQAWARDACGDIWLGFDPDDLTHWARDAGLQQGRHLYLAQRNGFSVQIREFNKASIEQDRKSAKVPPSTPEHPAVD